MKDGVIMLNSENFVWVEKYRPKTINETILTQEIKDTVNNFIKQGNIPHFLFSGRQGVGKTTIAKALVNELDSDYLFINASMHGNIDMLRNDISSFASSVSLNGDKRKFVILDEADYLTPTTQAALRSFMEEYSRNCGFILTCNVKSRIIDPLQSRCAAIDFVMPAIDSKQGGKIAMQIHKRAVHILETENVEYDPRVIALLVSKHYPDFRRLINELQRAASHGKITTETLSVDHRGPMDALVEFLKAKNFTGMRTWVGENTDIDSAHLFRAFYERAYEWVTPSDIPNLVLLIGEYQFKAAFVADHEINTAAFLTQVMSEIEFKS
jgi:DNA polymerase III delta prime subunit